MHKTATESIHNRYTTDECSHEPAENSPAELPVHAPSAAHSPSSSPLSWDAAAETNNKPTSSGAAVINPAGQPFITDIIEHRDCTAH